MAFDHLNLAAWETHSRWNELLSETGLPLPEPAVWQPLDLTLGEWQGSRLVATGSVSGNRLEFIAIAQDVRDGGATFNRLLTALLDACAERGIFHVFVSTKREYTSAFEHIGFHMLASASRGVLLETGDTQISDYLQQLAPVAATPGERLGAVVMHANPFTRGHRSLLDRALRTCDRVVVFVLSDTDALFDAKTRLSLVTEGTADLGPRISVVPGGDYVVSAVTFPAYFLDNSDQAAEYQAELDAQLFRNHIAPALGISTRYLGEEPTSMTTAQYNRVLARVLPPQVEVHIVPRIEAMGAPISASEVRRRIEQGQLKELQHLVPPSTLSYIHAHFTELQVRAHAISSQRTPS